MFKNNDKMTMLMYNSGGQGAREIMAGFEPLFMSCPVQCGAMTVIWVSILPGKEVDAYRK